jgi:hypothetical protein
MTFVPMNATVTGPNGQAQSRTLDKAMPDDVAVIGHDNGEVIPVAARVNTWNPGGCGDFGPAGMTARCCARGAGRRR